MFPFPGHNGVGAVELSHRAVIEQLGGNTVVAEALGLTGGAVCRWKIRGIPARYWPKLVRLARKLDPDATLTIDDLEVAACAAQHGRCAA